MHLITYNNSEDHEVNDIMNVSLSLLVIRVSLLLLFWEHAGELLISGGKLTYSLLKMFTEMLKRSNNKTYN